MPEENPRRIPRLVPLKQLRERFGITLTRDHLRLLTKSKKFPAPISVGGRHIAWLESEIIAHIEDKLAGRRGS